MAARRFRREELEDRTRARGSSRRSRIQRSRRRQEAQTQSSYFGRLGRIAVELSIDGARRDAEELGGDGFVTLRVLERLLDDAELDLAERRAHRELERTRGG